MFLWIFRRIYHTKLFIILLKIFADKALCVLLFTVVSEGTLSVQGWKYGVKSVADCDEVFFISCHLYILFEIH